MYKKIILLVGLYAVGGVFAADMHKDIEGIEINADVLRRLKEHSKMFQDFSGDVEASEKKVYKALMETPGQGAGLESMMHILKVAKDDSEAALMHSCDTYMQALHKTDITELFKAVSYLNMPCMMDVCARPIAAHYASEDTLREFIAEPQVFVQEIIEQGIGSEQQTFIIRHLLQKYKNTLTKPHHIDDIWSGDPNGVYTLDYNHDISRLALGFNDGTVCICNLGTIETSQMLQCKEKHHDYVCILAWSQDDLRLAAVCSEGISIWNTLTGQLLNQYRKTYRYNGYKDCPFNIDSAAAWNPSGSLLAVGCAISSTSIGYIAIMSTETGQQLGECNLEDDWIINPYVIAWSPDGSWLAAGSGKTVRVWREITRKQMPKCNEHTDTISSVAWSPDAFRLASGSYDGTVCIWDPKTGQLQQIFRGHDCGVSAVDWSSNGLVSGFYDGTVDIWDPKTGQLQQQCDGPLVDKKIKSVAWNSDGLRLVLEFYDGTVRIWKMTDYHESIKSLNLVQALYVYRKLSNYDAAEGEYKFEELHDSLPDNIKLDGEQAESPSTDLANRAGALLLHLFGVDQAGKGLVDLCQQKKDAEQKYYHAKREYYFASLHSSLPDAIRKILEN